MGYTSRCARASQQTTAHPQSTSAEEIVMRPSRFLVVMFVLFAVLLLLTGASPAQTVIDIYSFTGQDSSASPSLVKLALGRDGRLYGTTGGQGGPDYGTIFKVAGTGGFKQLYTFDDTSGAQPDAGVMLASDGNFYGTADSGGSAGHGVLFKISPDGTYTVLYEFTGGVDGTTPTSPPFDLGDGNFYGTTYGSSTISPTTYKYTAVSGTLTTIYQFDQAHGSGVVAPLIRAADGNLYGTAFLGGANNCGSIFKLTTSGTLLWYYSFPCAPGGANPIGPLVQATDGNFYGTTYDGGTSGLGVGTIFKLDQGGTVSILYSFQGGGTDGSSPDGGLVQATDGNLYGSTQVGGTRGHGTLFQISTAGAYKLLYNFANKGSDPAGELFQHTNGLLYGTTAQGGSLGFGVVYRLDMKLEPFVALVNYGGKAGGTAQILGQGLTGTTAVTFNGIAATSFKVVSDTFMTAVVPNGATTGKVVVTTPSGALTSNVNFRISR
jgi:uncharacterized repeat protein (TIGR03803 family)